MLRRGGVLFTPVPVAACAAVKSEPNESTATAAIKMLKVRIKFLPVFRTLNRSINAECQSQFPCFAANVRFGLIADILQCDSHMRFTPESGHVRHN